MFKYVEKQSMLHRADPVAKILFCASTTLIALFAKNIIVTTLILSTYVALIAASKLSLKIEKNFLYLGLLVVLAQTLMQKTPTETLASVLKILVLYYSMQTISLSTHPNKLVKSLQNASFFGKHLPYELVFVLGTAIRITPKLQEEYKNIVDSQSSRGIDYETKNVFKKIRNSAALIVPLVSISLNRAQKMAYALESKGLVKKE